MKRIIIPPFIILIAFLSILGNAPKPTGTIIKAVKNPSAISTDISIEIEAYTYHRHSILYIFSWKTYEDEITNIEAIGRYRDKKNRLKELPIHLTGTKKKFKIQIKKDDIKSYSDPLNITIDLYGTISGKRSFIGKCTLTKDKLDCFGD